MGLVSRILNGAEAVDSIGHAAKGVAEVFTPNATRQMELQHEAYASALAQHGVEFGAKRPGLFDRFVNGLNRLPRPMLALGTLGLFIYAMVDPGGFSQRMAGLAFVPGPLWWLLGAIVSFYFGAREMHYVRDRKAASVALPAAKISAWRNPRDPDHTPDANPALQDWNAVHQDP